MVTGGAGYTGSVLIPKLLQQNYEVIVLDLMMYGEDTLPEHKNLSKVKMDIRNKKAAEYLKGVYAVIHLAGISNDPGNGVSKEVGEDVNFYAVKTLLKESKKYGVSRFIYPSSCSVYGNARESELFEHSAVEPLTEYARCKALSEKEILLNSSKDFVCTILRPATVCGFSPRQRFDLLVNRLTNLAYHNREIELAAPNRIRPVIHIEDLANIYINLLQSPADDVEGQIFNAAFENTSILKTASKVGKILNNNTKFNIHEDIGTDNRSYKVNSDKLVQTFKYNPSYNAEYAIKKLHKILENKKLINTLDDSKFHNHLTQPMYFSGNIKNISKV